MSRKRLFATSAGTIACALAIGFFMQQGGQTQNRSAAKKTAVPPQTSLDAPQPVEQQELVTANLSIDPSAARQSKESTPDLGAARGLSLEPAADGSEPETLDLDKITLTSIDVAPALSAVTATLGGAAAFESGDSEIVLSAPADPVMPRLGCEVHASATAVDGANVVLSVEAPCNRNERLTIHHIGMIFTEVTSPEGVLNLTVPALAENAVFIFQFDGNAGAVANVAVPDLDAFDRVALQWSGSTGFQVHAREFGAAYGDAGHVWSGSSRTADTTGNGHIVRLGDADTLNPNTVEIYTFPRAESGREGVVALTVEAEVTQANCGRDIAAQSLELSGAKSPRTRDLILSMPDCDSVGDFLVLNNLLDDLKIAAR